MAIEFECPVCGATIRVKDEAAGKKGRCPKCQTLLLVPDPGPEEETQPPPAPPAATEATSKADTAAAAPPPTFPPIAEMPPTVEVPTVPPPAPPAPSPLAADPSSPFGIVPEPEPLVPPALAARRKGTFPTAKVVSAAVGILCIALVVGVGWWLYQSSKPDLSQEVTGDRLRQVALAPATFSIPDGVPSADADRVMARLEGDGLSLKSEYVEVSLRSRGGQVEVTVVPGSQAAAVRVPLGKNDAVRAALAKPKKKIAETKHDELSAAASKLFADYSAYLNEKKPLTRLPEHRDAVAFNATTNVVGYAIEAVIAEHPFRCVAEDADGNCYFFLPTKTKRFRIRGRTLPDGTTPLPVDFEVTIKEGPAETVTVEAPEPTGEAGETKEGGKAEESEPAPAVEPKPKGASMPEPAMDES